MEKHTPTKLEEIGMYMMNIHRMITMFSSELSPEITKLKQVENKTIEENLVLLRLPTHINSLYKKLDELDKDYDKFISIMHSRGLSQ